MTSWKEAACCCLWTPAESESESAANTAVADAVVGTVCTHTIIAASVAVAKAVCVYVQLTVFSFDAE